MIFCKQIIAYWWTIVKSHWFISNVLHGSIYKKNKIVGELLRNTHSIEKGMSLENVRLGFGTLKILAALRLVEEYLKYGEQVICCLGIGNLKRSYAVPVSHRMKPETIIHNVNVNK